MQLQTWRNSQTQIIVHKHIRTQVCVSVCRLFKNKSLSCAEWIMSRVELTCYWKCATFQLFLGTAEYFTVATVASLLWYLSIF